MNYKSKRKPLNPKGLYNINLAKDRAADRFQPFTRYTAAESEIFQKRVENTAFNHFVSLGILSPFDPDLFVVWRDDLDFFTRVSTLCQTSQFVVNLRATDYDDYIVYVSRQCFYLGCISAGSVEINDRSLSELSESEKEALINAIFERSSSNIFLENKDREFIDKLEDATSRVPRMMLNEYRDILHDDDKLILFMQSFYRVGRTFAVHLHYEQKSRRK